MVVLGKIREVFACPPDRPLQHPIIVPVSLEQIDQDAVSALVSCGCKTRDARAAVEGARSHLGREAQLPERPEQVIALVERRHAQRRFRIWDTGVRVAFAASVDAGKADGRIGLVYTVPEHRRRGYAAALVAAAVREQLAEGKQRLFLTTDAANPTSNAIYARLGFQPVSDAYRFDFLPAGSAS